MKVNPAKHVLGAPCAKVPEHVQDGGTWRYIKVQKSKPEGHCIACWRKQASAYVEANPETVAAYRAKYRKDNAALLVKKSAAWVKANPEKAKATDIAYREANKAKLKADKAAWAAANKEGIKAAKAAYWASNKEALSAAAAARYRANPEPVKARSAAWLRDNPEKAKETSDAWRKANPEKVRASSTRARARNPERIRAAEARYAESAKGRAAKDAYYKENKEAIKANHAAWKKANHGTVLANVKKRKLAKLQRVMPWADLDKIASFYKLAADFGLHVDHIVPAAGQEGQRPTRAPQLAAVDAGRELAQGQSLRPLDARARAARGGYRRLPAQQLARVPRCGGVKAARSSTVRSNGSRQGAGSLTCGAGAGGLQRPRSTTSSGWSAMRCVMTRSTGARLQVEGCDLHDAGLGHAREEKADAFGVGALQGDRLREAQVSQVCAGKVDLHLRPDWRSASRQDLRQLHVDSQSRGDAGIDPCAVRRDDIHAVRRGTHAEDGLREPGTRGRCTDAGVVVRRDTRRAVAPHPARRVVGRRNPSPQPAMIQPRR